MSTATGLRFNHPLRIQIPLPEAVAAKAPAHLTLPILQQGIVLPRILNSSSTPIHDNLGWDTVFAVPVTEVNKHFSVPNLYPLDYDGKVSGSLFSVEVKGNFNPWSIALGGSGSIVNLEIPIANGQMTGGSSPIDLSGGSLFVEVKLNYLPQPSDGSSGTPNNLQVSTKAMNPSGHIAEVTSVTIPHQTDPTLLGAIQGAFQNFFDNNLGRITYIFNTVNLNEVADQGQFQWIKPTYTSYAYFDAATLDLAVFGVLCMVGGNSPELNTDQIGPGSIPQGSQSGFNISNQLFLKQMVLPVMANSFNANNSTTIDQSYFQITNNDTVISNTKTIPMAKVTYGGINYHPECTDLTVTLQATQLIVYTKIHTEISPGIDAYVESTNYFDLTLRTDDKGDQYLDFETTTPASTNHWVDVAEGIVITEIIIGIIGAVAGVVVGVVLKGAAAIIYGIIIAVVAGIAAAVPQLIAAVQGSGVIGKIPTIDGLVTDATNSAKWSGGQEFLITMVQLNGSLQLGGNAFPT